VGEVTVRDNSSPAGTLTWGPSFFDDGVDVYIQYSVHTADQLDFSMELIKATDFAANPLAWGAPVVMTTGYNDGKLVKGDGYYYLLVTPGGSVGAGNSIDLLRSASLSAPNWTRVRINVGGDWGDALNPFTESVSCVRLPDGRWQLWGNKSYSADGVRAKTIISVGTDLEATAFSAPQVLSTQVRDVFSGGVILVDPAELVWELIEASRAQWQGAEQSIVVRGVSISIAVTTTLFTVPTGKKFVATGASVIIQTLVGAAPGGFQAQFIRSSDNGNILGTVSFIRMEQAELAVGRVSHALEIVGNVPIGTSAGLAASAIDKVQIQMQTDGGTWGGGNSCTGDVILRGYFI
ncbi:MAG TPA: hypothetical protein VF614_06235, partial [Chthoniobacteraceae bacterium]|jgi:hypothetical protein